MLCNSEFQVVCPKRKDESLTGYNDPVESSNSNEGTKDPIFKTPIASNCLSIVDKRKNTLTR
jgi:hypothetical protein